MGTPCAQKRRGGQDHSVVAGAQSRSRGQRGPFWPVGARVAAAMHHSGAPLHPLGAKSVIASKSGEIIFASPIRNPEVFRN
jgi:hypothetical protein